MGIACSVEPGKAEHFDNLAEDEASDDVAPDWLSIGLVNAFDDPPEPSHEEESEADAGAFAPPASWRHSLPNDGIYTPLQWTRPLPCACVDWAEPRSSLCACLNPFLAVSIRACAPAALSGPFTIDVGSKHWDVQLLELLREPSSCPPELSGWWWVDGDVTRSGQLITFHDALWRTPHACRKGKASGVVRPHTAQGLAASVGALFDGAAEEYVFEAGYRRAYVMPGGRWLFRITRHEFRVVEYATVDGRTNALRSMYRLRRILLPTNGSMAKSKYPPARAEFVARARAPAPHEAGACVSACCGWAGAPACPGDGLGAAERLDNAVVAVNPRAHFMWRRDAVPPTPALPTLPRVAGHELVKPQAPALLELL